MAKTYSATDIQVLEGLDAVRMRPGMYIGSTGQRGLHHLIWEIVDNAIDEASNGFATEISVTLKKDGSCEVTDNGRGIPVDIHPQLGRFGSGSRLHAIARGGKIQQQELRLFRGASRRGRLGGQRAERVGRRRRLPGLQPLSGTLRIRGG